MLRNAACACGQLGLVAMVPPKMVVSCGCVQCQKRTGSVFGVSSYFNHQQVIKTYGIFTEFSVKSDSGRVGMRRFCPECGSTWYWFTDLFPGKTGMQWDASQTLNFQSLKRRFGWNPSTYLGGYSKPLVCRRTATLTRTS